MSRLKDFLTVSRANIQMVSLASALLGPSIGADSLGDILRTDVIIFIILFYTEVTFSCNINCYYDKEVDKLYKRNLYIATENLGSYLKYIMVLEVSISIILSSVLLFHGRWLAAILALAGIFISYSYSAPPLRIKGRGVWSPLPVMLGIYILPIIAGYSIVSMDFSSYFWMFIIGYFLMNFGINLVNVAEDVDVDSEKGIVTMGVKIGAKKTLLIGAISQFLGTIAPISLFLMKCSESILVISFFLISLLTSFYTFTDILRIYLSEDPEKAAKKGGKKLPLWFVITRYPLLFMAIFSAL